MLPSIRLNNYPTSLFFVASFKFLLYEKYSEKRTILLIPQNEHFLGLKVLCRSQNMEKRLNRLPESSGPVLLCGYCETVEGTPVPPQPPPPALCCKKNKVQRLRASNIFTPIPSLLVHYPPPPPPPSTYDEVTSGSTDTGKV